MPANEKLAWEELKATMADLYSRYEVTESPRQKSLRSWAGTLIICAGLCLIGVVIGIDYNTAETSSFRSAMFSFLGSQRPRAEQSAINSEDKHQSKEKSAAELKK